MTQPQATSYDDLLAATSQIVTWLIEDAGDDPVRWCELVSHFDAPLPPADRDRLLSAFETSEADKLGEHGKNEVWRALLGLSARHRKFADAEWAMPGDFAERVEAAANRFAPTSAVDLSVDLFGHRPDLRDVDRKDYARYEEALLSARIEAARAVLDSDGIAGILRLGAAVKRPDAVGWAAADSCTDELSDGLLPLLGTDNSDGSVAHGYAEARIAADGLDWLVRQLQRWPDMQAVPQVVGLLLAVPQTDEALVTIVDGMSDDIRAAFWRQVNPFHVRLDARPIAARKLMEHRRNWGAVEVLVSMLHAPGGAVDPDAHLIESALTSAGTGPSDDSPRGSSMSWEIGQLLDCLERAESDIQIRARLEFIYARLLQHTRTARALHKVLGSDPALFSEILSYIFIAEGESRDADVPPQRRAIAEVGFTVIRAWRTPPGTRDDQTMDADHLRGWITEARRLLAESGRSIIGDVVIGEVVGHVPPGEDGQWPAEPVRDLVESLRSTRFETGLQTGKYNSRDMGFRSLEDGGTQERRLATQHRQWADQVSDRWPRTGALLRRIADDYDRWAHREDDQSKQFQDDGN